MESASNIHLSLIQYGYPVAKKFYRALNSLEELAYSIKNLIEDDLEIVPSKL